MLAFSATEKSYFTLVGGSQLAKPPNSKVIIALGASNLDRR
jgi:hypothetical protein